MVTGRYPFKGVFSRVENGAVVSIYPFQFNPSNWTRDLDVNYSLISPAGSAMPTAIFQGIVGDVVNMTLLLDATEGYSRAREGVKADMAELESYSQPEIDRYLTDIGQFISPPQVIFSRGEDFWTVIVPKMTFRTVRENTYGYPTRVFVDIKMQAVFTNIQNLQTKLRRLERLRRMVTLDVSAKVAETAV
jgi:hypothetical protein